MQTACDNGPGLDSKHPHHIEQYVPYPAGTYTHAHTHTQTHSFNNHYRICIFPQAVLALFSKPFDLCYTSNPCSPYTNKFTA